MYVMTVNSIQITPSVDLNYSLKSLDTASSDQQKGKRGNKKGKQSTESDGSTTDRPKTYIKFVLFQFSYALL